MYVDPNKMTQPPMMKMNMSNIPSAQQKFPLKQNFKQQGMKQIFNPIQFNQMNQMNPNYAAQYRGDYIKPQGHIQAQIPLSGQKIMPQQMSAINPFINNQINKTQVGQTHQNISQQISQPKQQSTHDQNELEDLAAEIYEVAESKYPE